MGTHTTPLVEWSKQGGDQGMTWERDRMDMGGKRKNQHTPYSNTYSDNGTPTMKKTLHRHQNWHRFLNEQWAMKK